MHNLNEQLAKLATLIETYGGCRSVKVVGKVDCKGDIDFSVDAKLVEIEDQQDPTKLTKLIAGYFESFIEDPTPNWVVEAFVELHKDGTHKRELAQVLSITEPEFATTFQCVTMGQCPVTFDVLNLVLKQPYTPYQVVDHDTGHRIDLTIDPELITKYFQSVKLKV